MGTLSDPRRLPRRSHFMADGAGRAHAAIELTTSTPKMYCGVRVDELTPALRAALASDPTDG